ncbi:unnamed protein product [Macrosiphum euphorbiae]|uniref:Uncharacterized protein n=1 Tax=Macrosiphum euphorbiae TaxID=13131 RepID=A0AAV0WS84_9HEMI|nr:unnamed protein product [Macrosiphum euphorbiae]
MQENVESENCFSNVLVYGLLESVSSTIPQLTLLEKLNISPAFSKVFRFGKIRAEIPRPLKIIIKSKAEASQLLESFNDAKLGGVEFPQDFRIVKDKTPLQRELLKSCHSELDKRVNRGESGLHIKYVNGVSKIVSNISKNGYRLPPQPKA